MKRLIWTKFLVAAPALSSFQVSDRIESNQSGSYNHVNNIVELFDVLPNFSFTTSETKRNY